MEETQIKKTVAEKITYYRKLNNLTQTELAEKINYSDKSVSKWERGEGLPDVCVLVQLSELFNIKVNDLVYDTEAPAVAPTTKLSAYEKHKILFTYLLSIGLVWLVATIVFVLLEIIVPDFKYTGYPFLVAIPVTFIVALVFSCIWRNIFIQFISTSAIIWGITICLLVAIHVENISLLNVITAILQLLTVIWYIFRYIRYRHKHPKKKAKAE